MIYHFKQPLMIVGFIVSLILSVNVFSADEPTPQISPPEPNNIGSQTQTPDVPSEPQGITTPVSEPEVLESESKQALESPESNIATENSIDLPEKVDGLALPQNAQSTIIPTNKATDIRVIIDISGSMKQNDPDNLRIPALNLIVEMIPDGARAGVWTFGQWVNMLIPPAIVDEKWRETAKQSTQQINSHGLRTNIGEAMEKAMWQLESDGEYEQHAILLTDGLVDIASETDPEQQAKNTAERQRIATEILKKYKDLGVKIHSIGLSNNADKVLLDKLALETGGSSVVVNSPDELVKAFLKAFEKAAPEVAEQVPLAQDNTFDIDASVEEFTALVFREQGSVPMQLISPSGVVISQIKGVDNARWFGESVYDLVTVSKPEAGKWKIEAELDPDNRVTVISDLKMDIRNLPNALFPGQQVNFDVFLHESGKVITNPDFLTLMTIEMTMTAESGRSGTKVISDPDNVPADGLYKESISRLSQEGQYELKIEVDGKTFKRMRKDYIQVRQPIGFEIRKIQADGVQGYAVRVIPQVANVEVARTRVIAKLKGPDQSSIIQAMPWIEEGVWEAVITPDKGPGRYEIAMNIKGTIGEDQEFRVKPDPINLTFPIPENFTHEYLVQSQKQEVTQVVPPVEPPEADKPDVKSESEAEAIAEKVIEEDKQEVAASEKVAEETENMDSVAPKLDEKMEQQEQAEAMSAPDMAASDLVEEEIEDILEPIPYWLYAAIPAGILVLGVGGFLVVRKLKGKKSAPSSDQEEAPKAAEKPAVSLNDGLDDEDFDEDFDLSGDDEDEMTIGIDAEESSIDPDPDDSADDVAADPVEDDIPDFDENFDVEQSKDDTASAIDDLDSVLDSLTDEDEQNIPKLDEAVAEDYDADAQSEEDSSIDAALAGLESELDDIDVDALIDDKKDS